MASLGARIWQPGVTDRTRRRHAISRYMSHSLATRLIDSGSEYDSLDGVGHPTLSEVDISASLFHNAHGLVLLFPGRLA